MSALLSIEHVSKVYPDGSEEITVLDRVSFELAGGAQLGLCGGARSGKSTLLRIAAGIEPPDSGCVRMEGVELTRLRGGARARLLRRAIGFVAISDWRPVSGESALDHVATALGSDGFTPREARRKALRALEQVGISGLRRRASVGSLGISERARLGVARALVREPRLLVVDEPGVIPSLSEREQFLQLLRGVAQERSIALLAASSELGTLGGMRLMLISDGELCRTDALEDDDNVVRLPLRNPQTRRPAR